MLFLSNWAHGAMPKQQLQLLYHTSIHVEAEISRLAWTCSLTCPCSFFRPAGSLWPTVNHYKLQSLYQIHCIAANHWIAASPYVNSSLRIWVIERLRLLPFTIKCCLDNEVSVRKLGLWKRDANHEYQTLLNGRLIHAFTDLTDCALNLATGRETVKQTVENKRDRRTAG